jgi:uncharacterized protein (DUF1800 family)
LRISNGVSLRQHIFSTVLGFGGPPVEIQKLADLGREAAVAALLDYEKIPDPHSQSRLGPAESEELKKYREAIRNGTPEEKEIAQREEQRSFQRRMLELRGWWLKRMATGSRPLQEKLVLFWHGHFATSVAEGAESLLHVEAE